MTGVDGAPPAEHHLEDDLPQWAQDRLTRLEQRRSMGFVLAVTRRFFGIDGLTLSGLLAIEFFTTIIPLMLISYSYLSGFAENASFADMVVERFDLTGDLAATVRSTFGTSAQLHSVWTVAGLAGFLFWGIPMSLTVARMYAAAWKREPFGFGQSLLRGGTWFVLYLVMLISIQRVSTVHGGGRVLAVLLGAVTAFGFWSLSPVLLVRDGASGAKFLALAGLAGMVIDALVLRIASEITMPILLAGWRGFGPIGVAMAFMTWCGVTGVGWVVTACVGAVLWERNAPARTVVAVQVPSDEEVA